MNEKPTVIALVGPTASGKTSLSLTVAQQLDAEIIACDSRTVYRYFDIGTAKPTEEEQNLVKHHLIDVCEPTEDFTVAQFCDLARAAIADITRRGKTPLLCGGTGFYARALLEGLSMPSVAPLPEVRSKWRAFADEQGNEALHSELRQVDPESADRLNMNDRYRIIRALEVYSATGQKFSTLATRVDPPYRTIWLGLTTNERTALHERIRLRFAQQLEEGMIAETEQLYERFGPHQKLLHTVNYKELLQYVTGQSDQAAAIALAVKHNVQLARRQLIWFRPNKAINWFEVDRLDKEQLAEEVLTYLQNVR